MLSHLLRKLASLIRPPWLPIVRASGWMWQLTPAGAALFGPSGPNFRAWVDGQSALVVKSGKARTVYRVELLGETIFVKHCKISGLRAWAREVIRPAKAQLEFENALALRQRGISAIEPLAWGSPDSRWPGESVLITRGLTATVPFEHYLMHRLPELPPDEQRAVRRQLAVTLAQFLAKLHDAGVAHPDPHPGNLLIEMPPSRVPHFTLIDLHDVRIGPPLDWKATRDNLVLYNRWFQLRASRTERSRFWRAYGQFRMTLPPPTLPKHQIQAREIELQTQVANLDHWAGRVVRSVQSNRHFRKVSAGAVRGFAVRDLPSDFLAHLLDEPDALIRDAARLHKTSDTSTVAELLMPTPSGPVPVVLKRVNVSVVGAMKNLIRPSQVMRSWINGHALRDRWLPTPRPLAVFHRRWVGLPTTGYLLTEQVPDAVGLDEAVRRCASVAALRELLIRVARMLRIMHDRGVSHRDLKAANILVTQSGEPVLIDLVGVRTRANLTMARRARELARLNASFLKFPAVTRAERLRFLLAYLSAGTVLQMVWKNWWRLVSEATLAKVSQNQRRGRMLG